MRPLSREEFDRLVAGQCGLVRSANDLEYRLYLLGEPQDERVADLRQAAGDLVTRLRDVLLLWDQAVLPRVEPAPDGCGGGPVR